MTYSDFLQCKRVSDAPDGLESVPAPNPMLFDFQRDIVGWALRRGRAAIFADCGMGKTLMQLEWAKHVPGRVLIFAPLAVAEQTVSEGVKFGVHVDHMNQDDGNSRIVVTNYERIEGFKPENFTGVVLDESSILKSYTGKFRTKLIEEWGTRPFRLAATATPAPNDFMELGNHSEFLGTMTRTEMLSMFFVHDGGDTSKWRLKGHASGAFWSWLASWAVMIRKPSDLGYPDGKYTLPPLKIEQHTIITEAGSCDSLLVMPAQTLAERIGARRSTIGQRVAAAAKLANDDRQPWVCWCNLNDESAALTAAIDGAVEVKGSDESSTKARRLMQFSRGEIRVLVTKPSIAGFGMNWQHCARMAFVGLSDSYEQFYQALRRCWRFGQTREVLAHVVTADIEGAVVDNIKRKEADAALMAEEMVMHMHDLNAAAVRGTQRADKSYNPNLSIQLPSFI